MQSQHWTLHASCVLCQKHCLIAMHHHQAVLPLPPQLMCCQMVQTEGQGVHTQPTIPGSWMPLPMKCTGGELLVELVLHHCCTDVCHPMHQGLGNPTHHAPSCEQLCLSPWCEQHHPTGSGAATRNNRHSTPCNKPHINNKKATRQAGRQARRQAGRHAGTHSTA